VALFTPSRLELPYRWNGTDGVVRAEVGTNDDPAAYGCDEFARGFPYCRATVEPPARGYGEMLGWVQIVDTNEFEPGFRIDLFEPLGEVPHPFAFFGISPTLFDSPHTTLPEWDFLAHTFLCGMGGKLFEQTEGGRREVRALLGFSWGLRKRGSEIETIDLEPLVAGDWDGHLTYLRGRFPTWTFPPGFFDGPLP
jgi:hypothetical protein